MTLIRFFNTIILFFSISILIAQDPPPNNTYQTALELTVQPGSCSTQTKADLKGATNSNNSDFSSPCFFDPNYEQPETYADVWFKATVPSSGRLTIKTFNRHSGLSGISLVAYTLSNGVLTEVDCVWENSANFPELELTEQTENTVIYVMAVEKREVTGYYEAYSHLAPFNICAYDPSALDLPQTPKPMLSYYSNPVGNRLSVESPYQIERLRVFDLMGKVVLHKTPQQQKLTLNTFTLAPGAYLLQVETPEGEQTVQLLKK